MGKGMEQMSTSPLLQRKWVVYVLILLITLIWGYGWVLMKEALRYMGPFSFSALRFGVGSVILFMIMFFMKMKRPPKEQLGHIVIVGLLQTAVVYLLVMYALHFVEAGKSSVLLYSMPIWSSFFAVKLLKEKITITKMVGLGLGVVGLIMIIGWDIFVAQDFSALFGEILIIIAAASWGLANVYYQLKVKGVSKIQVTAYQMGFGTLGITAAAIGMEWGEPIQFNVTSIYYILFTGALASALCFTLWFIVLSMIDIVTATISTLLVPVFGLLFSAVLLGEKITAGVILGSCLILAGIFIAQLPMKKMEQTKSKSLTL